MNRYQDQREINNRQHKILEHLFEEHDIDPVAVIQKHADFIRYAVERMLEREETRHG